MNEKSLTETQLATTISSLVADIDHALAAVPTLLDPAVKRRGRRRADRVQGPGQRRQQLQLQLAQAALVVAQAAVAGLPVAALVERMGALQRSLGELQRRGQGFIEVRNVLRPVVVATPGPTGAAVTTVERHAFGPYAYYRWHVNELRSS